MDIPQGNRIDPALAEQLEIGMSRSQVEFLLGTPAIVDAYHPDQWFISSISRQVPTALLPRA
ncbi:MAG: outer membrane protein assembly factor BamE [Gammaproteobacteria bacterium]